MNKDFKKIAKQLGIVIPACLLSMGVAKAETANDIILPKIGNVTISEISKSNFFNNEVVKFMTADLIKSAERMSPDHTDSHTDMGGNHADRHSDISHVNSHTNKDAKQANNQCYPHSNSHTNRDGYNSHTNSGNKSHTDYHTDRNVKPNC